LKTIYLHIGFGKTGTSSVQEFFFGNREEFANQDLQYPMTGLIPYAHHGLALFQFTEMPEGVQNLYLDLLEEIRNSPCSKVLLSSEQFCFLKKAYVAKVGSLFSEFKVKIIFYVRTQTKLIESTFLEWQKADLDYKGNIDNFYNVAKRGFDFSLRLQPWIEVFGSDSIVVRVYDKKAIGDDTCLDVMKVLGLGLNEKVSEANLRSNISLLPEFSKILGLVDKSEIAKDQRKLIVNELLQLSKYFKQSSSCSLLSEELKRDILNHYASSNELLSQQFLSKNDRKIFLGN